MTGSSTVKRISPMLAAADMNETISFYQSVLGFTPTMKSERYSILERDEQTIHFQKAESAEIMNASVAILRSTSNISGIHALWDHVKTFGTAIPYGIYLTGNTGMTEFHMRS